MRLPADVRIGVATHTGRVRRSNEDDYLLLAPAGAEDTLGQLVAIADGMGGVSGGAEASRAAVRALGAEFLRDDAAELAGLERMRSGFAAACRRVFELSHDSPSLRSMGTTMTAVNLLPGRAVVGHVGDSRCYLLRAGKLEQMTQDHALLGENRLTRCIGGGRESEEVDVSEWPLRPDDRLLLVTDGIWEAVSDDELQQIVSNAKPEQAAVELVQLANAHGGQDNGTALVIHLASSARGTLRETALPAEEVREPTTLTPVRSLRPAHWPWWMLLASAVLGGLAVARVALGFDVIVWLREVLGRL